MRTIDVTSAQILADLHAAIVASRGLHHEAAEATGGVPVYADMGGVLCLSPTGAVCAYDIETLRVRPVEDHAWTELALARAAALHPALAALDSPRPGDADRCVRCAETGIFHGAICSTCLGRGWVARRELR